jgi:hypothetical protein
VLAQLKDGWTPEKVMSRDKKFLKLCKALKDPQAWNMLSRADRRFINRAVDYLDVDTQKSLGR